jgi:hypothetical protein
VAEPVVDLFFRCLRLAFSYSAIIAIRFQSPRSELALGSWANSAEVLRLCRQFELCFCYREPDLDAKPYTGYKYGEVSADVQGHSLEA